MEDIEIGFWIICILFVLIVLIGIILLFVNSIPPPEPEPVNELKNTQEDLTGFGVRNINMIDCKEAANLQWENNSCTCKFPFDGSYCITEEHVDWYKILGKINDSNNLGDFTYSNDDVCATGLSYVDVRVQDPESCTAYCGNDPLCNAVEYSLIDGMYVCKLINSDIIIKNDGILTDIPDRTTNIYINRARNVLPKFIDQVKVFAGPLSPEYWTINTEIVPTPTTPNGFISSYKDTITQISWIPTGIVNDGNMIGTWATSINDLNNNVNIWTDTGTNGILNFPPDFYNKIKNNTLYFKYTPKK